MTISFNPSKWSWFADHWHHISGKNAYPYYPKSLSVSLPNRLITEPVTRDGPSLSLDSSTVEQATHNCPVDGSNPSPDTTLAVQPQPITVVEEPHMSLFTEIEAAGKKIGDELLAVVTFATNIKKIYSALSGPTLAAVAAVFYDAVKGVVSIEAVAADAAAGNITGAITLSQTTITLLKQVVSDFKAGETTIVADFKALGITL